MKFTSPEEYGLRCLLRIARDGKDHGLTIPEISKTEGISEAYTAKLLRILRLGGFLESSRGQTGGYTLSRKPEEIKISDVLNILGGRLYDDDFCSTYTGEMKICTNSVDCSIRSLWQLIQYSVDNAISKITLMDLISSGENQITRLLNKDGQPIKI